MKSPVSFSNEILNEMQSANNIYYAGVRKIKELCGAHYADGYLLKQIGGYYQDGENVDLVEQVGSYRHGGWIKAIVECTIQRNEPPFGNKTEHYKLTINKIKEGDEAEEYEAGNLRVFVIEGHEVRIEKIG